MKKCILLLAVLFGLNSLSISQNNFSIDGEPAVIYSLPKTELCIEIEVEKTTQTPGEFYRYSERYLATKDVITGEKTNYRLKEVKVKTRSVADPARTYSVTSTKSFPLNNISVNEKGIICGINVPCKATFSSKKTAEKTKAETETSRPLPLTEEYMLAGSTAKMAEGAAKQIYRIRESRIALLTADVDQLPADGESMKAMLEGMDKMEKELTELFTGNNIVESQTYTIYLDPSPAMKDEVLFRISSLKGLVAANDLSGSPYYISITPSTISSQPGTGRKSTGAPELYSVLPAPTQITIGDGKNTYYSEQFLIPQFGITVPLPEDLLKRKDAKIRIDERTGRLLRVE